MASLLATGERACAAQMLNRVIGPDLGANPGGSRKQVSHMVQHGTMDEALNGIGLGGG